MKTYSTDSAGRLCLGKQFANKNFIFKLNEHGSIDLTPVKIIPEREAWLYENKTALNAVNKGLKQAKQGKGKPLSLKK